MLNANTKQINIKNFFIVFKLTEILIYCNTINCLYICLTHMSNDQISINNLSKVYDNGFEALKKINLNIKKGEIFAMLGPNGAGKTTLISIICGIVNHHQEKLQ